MSEPSKRQASDPALEAVLTQLERVALGQGAQTRELMASLEKERKARERLEREAQELVKRLRTIARDLDDTDAPATKDGAQNGQNGEANP